MTNLERSSGDRKDAAAGGGFQSSQGITEREGGLDVGFSPGTTENPASHLFEGFSPSKSGLVKQQQPPFSPPRAMATSQSVCLRTRPPLPPPPIRITLASVSFRVPHARINRIPNPIK